VTRARDIADQQDNLGGAVPPFAAGKNFVINGGMDIWQRGTTLSFGAFDPRYLADRWLFFVGTAGNTISQETTTVPAGARYAYKYTSTAAGGTFGVYQGIETANTLPLVGKTVTLQAQVTGTTGKTVAVYLYSSTGVDTTPISVTTVVANSADVALTSGTFSTITITATIPSNVRTLKVGVISGGTFANTEHVIFGNVQLEIGSVATPFSRAGGSIGGELALCQRYYYRTYGAYTGQYNAIPLTGYGSSSTSVWCPIQHPVKMRVTPYALDYANIGFYAFRTAGNFQGGTWTLNTSSPDASCLNYATTGITANDVGVVNNAIAGTNTSYFGLTAEL
jgi:hypothetical protein